MLQLFFQLTYNGRRFIIIVTAQSGGSFYGNQSFKIFPYCRP